MNIHTNITKISRAASAPTPGDRLIKQAEVQAMLGVAASTVEQWRLKGHGPKFVKLGRAVRYRISDVNAYIASLAAFGSTTEADHAAEA